MNKKCGIINVSAAVEMSQVTFKKERCYCFCVCELKSTLFCLKFVLTAVKAWIQELHFLTLQSNVI